MAYLLYFACFFSVLLGFHCYLSASMFLPFSIFDTLIFGSHNSMNILRKAETLKRTMYIVGCLWGLAHGCSLLNQIGYFFFKAIKLLERVPDVI